MAIGVDGIFLSLKNDDGEYLTANVYTVDGVYEADNVTPRRLSIGQLVMALCLQRAAELELDIVKKMNSLEDTTGQLEGLTEIEKNVLEGDVNLGTKKLEYKGVEMTYYNFLTEILLMDDVPSGTVNEKSSDFIAALESQMDSKNSFSQQTMIELQSQTTKRDQAYDMVSNILKSVNNGLVGNANNL